MRIVDFFSRVANLAIAGAAGAGLMGLMAWSAGAVSPIMQGPPIQWAGGVPFIGSNSVDGNTLITAYTVPSGSNFMLTDLILGNLSLTMMQAAIYSPNPGQTCSQGVVNERLTSIVVPPSASLVVPLNTGVGFGPGKIICYVASENSSFNIRGYLFKPT